MEIQVDGEVLKVTEITNTMYNVTAINSIQRRYKALRQKSKAPS